MNRKAYTLLEVLVAAAILSVIATTLYYAFKRGLDVWRCAEEKLDVYQNARVAIEQMSRELASAIAVEGEIAFYGTPSNMAFIAIIGDELKEVTYNVGANYISASYSDCDFNFSTAHSQRSGDLASGVGGGGFLYWGPGTTSWESASGEVEAEEYWTSDGTPAGAPSEDLPKAVKIAFSLVYMNGTESFDTVVYLRNSE